MIYNLQNFVIFNNFSPIREHLFKRVGTDISLIIIQIRENNLNFIINYYKVIRAFPLIKWVVILRL